jgi:hypothetical protein
MNAIVAPHRLLIAFAALVVAWAPAATLAAPSVAAPAHVSGTAAPAHRHHVGHGGADSLPRVARHG